MSPILKDAGDGGWARGAYAPLRLGHSGALTEEGGRPGRQHAERLSRGTRGGVARGAKGRGGRRARCEPRLGPGPPTDADEMQQRKERGTANPAGLRKEAGREPGHFETG